LLTYHKVDHLIPVIRSHLFYAVWQILPTTVKHYDVILGYDEGSHDGDEVKLYHIMLGMSSLYIAVIEGLCCRNHFSQLTRSDGCKVN